MQTYIALLRGINVGGHKKIIMADLRMLLAQANLANISTYIQSGNIIFESKDTAKVLQAKIHQAILKKYGFEVPIIVFKQSFLTQVSKENPFLKKDPNLDIKMLYVAFLSEKPSQEHLKILREKYNGDDEFVLAKKVVYLYYKHGAGRTKLTNNYLETHLKVSATSRNWKTTLRLTEKEG